MNQGALEDKELKDPNEKSLEELTDYLHAGYCLKKAFDKFYNSYLHLQTDSKSLKELAV